MAAYLGLHGALHNYVELLARVAGKLYGHMLLGLTVWHGDKEGLGGLVLKERGKVQVFEAVAAGDGQAVPVAHDGVAGEGGAYPPYQIGGVHAEALGAFIDEGEAEILLPLLTAGVLLRAHACAAGHLLLGEACYLPHGAYAQGGLLQLGFQICFFHWESP